MVEEKSFNDRVAVRVSDFVGNMRFFWGSLLFIIVLRAMHPPTANTFLLNLENDLQFLLLATNAVVNARQSQLLLQLIHDIRTKADTIQHVEQEIRDKL